MKGGLDMKNIKVYLADGVEVGRCALILSTNRNRRYYIKKDDAICRNLLYSDVLHLLPLMRVAK